MPRAPVTPGRKSALCERKYFYFIVVEVLAKTQSRFQNRPMPSRLAANVFIRVALAVIFGFMSLLHGPIMASAQSGPAHHMMAAADQAGVHYHHAAGSQSVPSMPVTAASCYGIGCFIALDPFVLAAAEANLDPIATLWPSRARALVAASQDPAVPPPRIRV